MRKKKSIQYQQPEFKKKCWAATLNRSHGNQWSKLCNMTFLGNYLPKAFHMVFEYNDKTQKMTILVKIVRP